MTDTTITPIPEIVADALRGHLSTLGMTELLTANHQAHIRLANAGDGVSRIARLVELGTLPQRSLDVANEELEAARFNVQLVHDAQAIDVRLRQDAEETFLATACPACDDERATGPLCEDCR